MYLHIHMYILVYTYTHNSCLESSKMNPAILTLIHFVAPNCTENIPLKHSVKPLFFVLPESPLQVIPFLFLQNSGGFHSSVNRWLFQDRMMEPLTFLPLDNLRAAEGARLQEVGH